MRRKKREKGYRNLKKLRLNILLSHTFITCLSHGSLSNICTEASELSLMASIKMRGRNLERTIRTFGPTSLSMIILAMREAVSSLTVGSCELQKSAASRSGHLHQEERGKGRDWRTFDPPHVPQAITPL